MGVKSNDECIVDGGCPSDYVAVSISLVSIILLLIRSTSPCFIHKLPRTNGSVFWLLCIQIFASFNFLLSIIMAGNFLRFQRRYWWQECYIWAGWFAGPLGFGLLMSCRIVQALKLYFLFVRRRLSPIRTYILLPLIVFPWIATAASVHIRKPLDDRCHIQTQWVIPVTSLYILYIIAMVGITQAVRHIEFRFRELKDLLQGIIVSTVVIAIWIASYITNEVHRDNDWLQPTSRFFLLLTASILILTFYSISISQPLLSQMSLRRNDPHEVELMGRALGIPDSGVLLQKAPIMEVDFNEPLDKLLLKKKFRQSFMAFADSCLAGESVHFYDEVHELRKIPVRDPVSRVYMARHIIEKYIVSGAEMEVNISHRTRQEILGTLDLAHPYLFDGAINELMQLMKTNLAKDYWSSIFFVRLKEEANKQSNNHDLMERMVGWDSPRPSSVHGEDDPFHQEHPLNGSGRMSAADDTVYGELK